MDGVKFDQEKPRWDLLELSLIEPAVRVLTMGAKKYSQEIYCEYSNSVLSYVYGQLEKCENVSCVRGFWGSGRLRECVAAATRKGCESETLATRNGNAKTAKSGDWHIGNTSRHTKRNITKIQFDALTTRLSIARQPSCGNTESPQRRSMLYLPTLLAAQYAEESLNPTSVTLTTTIMRGKYEESFVIVATGDLECLEILKNVCTLQFGILGNARVSPSSPGYKIISSGKDNWKHVPDAKTRYFAALMRHLTAWQSGEAMDPESGESHLAHAICCLVFLTWFEDHSE